MTNRPITQIVGPGWLAAWIAEQLRSGAAQPSDLRQVQGDAMYLYGSIGIDLQVLRRTGLARSSRRVVTACQRVPGAALSDCAIPPSDIYSRARRYRRAEGDPMRQFPSLMRLGLGCALAAGAMASASPSA